MKFLRPALYITVFIVGVLFVEAKKEEVRVDKAREVESVLSIINDQGLPIKTYELKPRTFSQQYLLHLKPCGQTRACFYSSYSERRLFKVGQAVNGYKDNSQLKGKILSVAQQAVGGSGLYEVVVQLEKSIDRPVLAEVEIKKMTDSIVVPIESVVQIKNKAQVYVFQNGKPVEREIIIAQKSRGEILVVSGLSFGEQVVVEGISQISQFDRFNVVGEFEFSRESQL